MSGNIKQFVPPVINANSTNGYSLAYALKHPRKSPHELPSGWRWLEIGEYPQAGDVCCDPRIAPVQILLSGQAMTDTHHPVRTKRTKRTSRPSDPSPTPWDFSTWGFYCDKCRKFFDGEDLYPVPLEDGYIKYQHKECDGPARYISYEQMPAIERLNFEQWLETSQWWNRLLSKEVIQFARDTWKEAVHSRQQTAQPSGAQGEGLRKALERLRDKWAQNSKGQSDSEYTSGMDYQSGVCADELNAALAAARRES